MIKYVNIYSPNLNDIDINCGLARTHEKLLAKFRYWKKRNKLDKEDAFYCTDKELMKDLNITDRTLTNHRKKLKEKGLINFSLGTGRGRATRYWVHDKGEKHSPFFINKTRNNDGLKEKIIHSEGENFSGPNIIKCQKGNKTSHISLPCSYLKEIYSSKSDKEATKHFFLSEGYTEYQIEEAWERLDLTKE